MNESEVKHKMDKFMAITAMVAGIIMTLSGVAIFASAFSPKVGMWETLTSLASSFLILYFGIKTFFIGYDNY
jgi:uncharacterized membrane protein HdeD (DUF308 family)